MNATKGTRYGYMTTVCTNGVHFAIFAMCPDKLRESFLQVTGGRVYFDIEKMDRVKITPIKTKEVAAQ